jgi:glycosyltransferase involved in cell wall biosynthesis
LPNAIVEAMSAGLPVIGTSVGGIPELILDGVTGLIVPPKNPEALSRAIVTLIENPEFRRQLGEEASVRAREFFDVKRSVQDYEKLYKDLSSNL